MLAFVVGGVVTAALVGYALGAIASGSQAPEASTPSASTTSLNRSVEATQTRCWNGSVADSMTACPEPVGRAGVLWVFPGLQTLGGSCRRAPTRNTTYTLECDYGERGLIRYRYWKYSEEGLKHYGDKYARSLSQDLTVDGQSMGTIWRYPRPMERDGLYKLSAFFEGHFSVSVEATTATKVDELITLVGIRSPASFRGSPSSGADAATFTPRWQY